jgi:hypothetical protein
LACINLQQLTQFISHLLSHILRQPSPNLSAILTLRACLPIQRGLYTKTEALAAASFPTSAVGVFFKFGSSGAVSTPPTPYPERNA